MTCDDETMVNKTRINKTRINEATVNESRINEAVAIETRMNEDMAIEKFSVTVRTSWKQECFCVIPGQNRAVIPKIPRTALTYHVRTQQRVACQFCRDGS